MQTSFDYLYLIRSDCIWIHINNQDEQQAGQIYTSSTKENEVDVVLRPLGTWS